MGRVSVLKVVLAVVSVTASFLVRVRPAGAADWSLPHSWRWPLYVRVDDGTQIKTGEPRPAVWTSTSELQIYSTTYLHPGIDIRGDHGDPVIVPADSTIERVFHYDDYCLQGGNYCRGWFKTADSRFLYYVSHIDLSPAPAPGRRPVTTEIREKFQNAVAGMGDRSVTAGQKMATLTMFSGVDTGWHHLHLGVIDRQSNYDLKDTLFFLEQHPSGETGASLVIVDDEPPVIRTMQIVRDQTGTNAVTTGVCGDEVWGQLDIAAEIEDTFFTSHSFATFPGKATLPSSTGIRTARYLVRSLATDGVVKQGTWFDLADTPNVCGADTQRNCLLPNTAVDDNVFFSRMSIETGDSSGAPSSGLSILNKLFDVGRTLSNYASSEVYWHILTNTQGNEASWDATTLSNGRYQVSIEAQDFEGNLAAQSRFVSVHDPATTLDNTQPGFGDVYVRDNANDVGAVPSTLGGKPFWESPDIILVPAGTPVTIDTLATETLVTPQGNFDIYVRMKNSGCSAVSGEKARVLSANPSAITTDWHTITTPDGQYIGDAQNPNGVTVNGGGTSLIGPFHWQPTAQDAQFGGHRCLLAAVSAPNDPVPAGAEFDAPNHNNVAQRNLQISNCQYQLPNPTSQNATLDLTITTDAAADAPNTVIEVIMDFDASWFAAWANVPGVQLSQSGSTMVVRTLLNRVPLPQVILPAGSPRNFSFVVSLPAGAGTHTVELVPVLNGAPVSGASCSDTGAQVPR